MNPNEYMKASFDDVLGKLMIRGDANNFYNAQCTTCSTCNSCNFCRGGGLNSGAGVCFDNSGLSSNAEIALAACQAKYGSCSSGGCGRFSYYYRAGGLQCNCNKPIGEYEFIYSNTGYTTVGNDYGGSSTSVRGNTLFTRVKTSRGCNSNSWGLALGDLGTDSSGCVPPISPPPPSPHNPPNPPNPPNYLSDSPPIYDNFTAILTMSDSTAYFQDMNCPMLTIPHSLGRGPYYIFLGADNDNSMAQYDGSNAGNVSLLTGKLPIRMETIRRMEHD
ncbi:hypothetical protein CYMTET_9395 [Cymbomonas tetramitiformis]|uniref:Uncharacterized protein n=1 Tax=Cymbomonas tetramitiformis TaxID=36881 RepID=A0AAE0GRE4_9CHLO|nr:hypothetical protein CYMTET_9395 [Cymbomonas tetramitiformis]